MPRNSETNPEKVDVNSICGVGQDVLEAAFKLNWNAVPRDELQASKKMYDPNIGKDPLMYSLQLVRSDKAEFLEAPIELLPAKPEAVQKERSTYIPGVKEVHQILYPKLSALMEFEQTKLFYYLRSKLLFKETLDAKKECDFQRLMTKAHEDYPVFQEFVKSMWRQHHYQRCYQVKPEIIHFIDSLWQKQCWYLLSIYPTLFKLVTNIPLNLNDPNQDHTVMEFVKNIAVRGGVPQKMKKPLIYMQWELISDVHRLSKIKPIMEPDSSKHVIFPIPPVSFDHHVDDLLLSEDIDVVITPSGIKTILDNSNTANEWILPFVIKNTLKANGTIKKVLFIDKKLPAHSMSVLNKIKWHAKMTAKWALLTAFQNNILGEDPEREIKKDKIEGGSQIDIASDLKSCNIDERQKEVIQSSDTDATEKATDKERTLNFYDDELDFEEVDEFGVAASTTENPLNQIVDQNRSADSSLKESETVVETPEKKASLVTSTTCQPSENCTTNPAKKKKKKKHTSPSISSIPSPSHENNPSQPNGDQTTSKKNTKISPRLLYNHWSLRKATHYKMSKHEQRTLNLLVRTRLDGVLYHSERVNETKWNNWSDEVYVSSKLDFQPEYGASVMDSSATGREYVDLYLRPKSKLARVRSVGHTQEVMLLEVKTLKELQVLQADPRRTFDSLYATLTALVDLAPGQYMLQHTPRGGTFAQAYLQNPNGTDLNLEQLYHSLTPVDVNAPPTTIDVSLFTKLHHQTQRPPGVLTPLPVQRSTILSKRTEKPSRSKIKKQKKLKKRLRSAMAKKSKANHNKTKET